MFLLLLLVGLILKVLMVPTPEPYSVHFLLLLNAGCKRCRRCELCNSPIDVHFNKVEQLILIIPAPSPSALPNSHQGARRLCYLKALPVPEKCAEYSGFASLYICMANASVNNGLDSCSRYHRCMLLSLNDVRARVDTTRLSVHPSVPSKT